MKIYRTLLTLSTADGTHIMPGSVIGLLDEERAAALIAAAAIVAAEESPAAPAPEPVAYPMIVEAPVEA
jgi:hypothetical protein